MSPAGPPALILDSCLWRELNPRNKSHLLIFGFCAAAFAAVLALNLSGGSTPAEALGPALNVAIMIFLAWAIARELDPDAPRSAFVAAALGALILLAGSAPAGVSLGMLVALRVVDRSTGKRPSIVDLVAVPVLAAAFSFAPRGWIGGVVMAAALVWDTVLPQAGPKRGYLSAVAALAAAFVVTVLRDTLNVGFDRPGILHWAVLTLAVVSPAAMRHDEPRSRADRSREPLSGERLRVARFLALGAGLVAFVSFGAAAIPLLAGTWAALIGIALHDRLVPSPAPRG
ncbi:MAG TPA: hypothetical protein VHI31_09100 [Actinomycetota bacterium]|nr:hypothetical protein [Actinomycetota bacterium]